MPLEANVWVPNSVVLPRGIWRRASHYFLMFAEAVLELHHIFVFEVPGLPKELRENSIRNDAG